jgi:hypothetical protein
MTVFKIWCLSEKSLLKVGPEPDIPAQRLNRKTHENKIMDQTGILFSHSLRNIQFCTLQNNAKLYMK